MYDMGGFCSISKLVYGMTANCESTSCSMGLARVRIYTEILMKRGKTIASY